MKRCPSCNQSYTDETLSFCLNDGAPLLSVADPPAPSFDAGPTVPYPRSRESNPPPTEVYRPARSPNSPYTPTPNWSPGPTSASQRSSALPWIIGGIVALVLLGIATAVIVGVIVAFSNASNSNNSNNSNYAANNSNRSYNSNSSNSSATQQGTPVPAKTLDVAGIWEGTSDESPATLVIRKSEDNTHDGVETAGEFKDEILVKVEFNPVTRHITITEVRLLNGTHWNLGINEGTVSSDGKSMSGTAKDTKGKTYSWSFSKKTGA